MATPLQPCGEREDGTKYDNLRFNRYEAIGNSRLNYEKDTRFPLMHLVNGYAEPGEEIRVISITPEYEYCNVHFRQIQEELDALQAEKGFICKKGWRKCP